MDLSAVMGLVIEPVRQRRLQLLFELLRRSDAAVLDGRGNARLVKALDKADDPPVFGFALGAQFVESLIQDGIQCSGSDIRTVPAASVFTNVRTIGTLADIVLWCGVLPCL
jgi:hypothetical protein